MHSNSALQFAYEDVIHIIIQISDMQANNALAEQFLAVFCAQSLLVAFLHDENDIGPAKVSRSDANTGTFFGSGRSGLMTIDTVEKTFCGRLRRRFWLQIKRSFIGVFLGKESFPRYE